MTEPAEPPSKAADPKAVAAAPMSRARTAVMVMLGSLIACGLFAWYQLNDHPLARWILALPQVGFVVGGIVSVLGSSDRGDGWHREIAGAIAGVVDRHPLRTCALILLLDIGVLWSGIAMLPVDVHCPPGFRLRYGTFGAEVACDVHSERLWMPTLSFPSDAWCVAPSGHGGWAPRLRYGAGHAEGWGGLLWTSPGGLDWDWSAFRWVLPASEELSCFEDGARVTAQSEPPGSLLYLEWGYSDTTEQVTVAPCAHLPPGLYAFDESRHECRSLGGPSVLTDIFDRAYGISVALEHEPGVGDPRAEAIWDGLRDIAYTRCTNCDAGPGDAGSDAALTGDADAAAAEHDAGQDAGSDAGRHADERVHVELTPTAGAVRAIDLHLDLSAPHAPAPPPAPTASAAPCRPGGTDQFTFYYDRGCVGGYSGLSLHSATLNAEHDISVGVSFRGASRHCVPLRSRRDGFLHLFVANDIELVYALTEDMQLVFVERVSGENRDCELVTQGTGGSSGT